MPKRDEVVGEARARVLIADDHPLLRSALRRLLEGAGNQIVAEAADGVAAVRLAFATKPHVALLDIMMPVMGGIEAARQISRGCPDTHVVMMSGYADADRRDSTLRFRHHRLDAFRGGVGEPHHLRSRPDSGHCHILLASTSQEAHSFDPE